MFLIELVSDDLTRIWSEKLPNFQNILVNFCMMYLMNMKCIESDAKRNSYPLKMRFVLMILI